MALGTPVSLGTASSAVSASTIALTLGTGVSIGDTVVVFVGCDTTGKTVSTVADNRSVSNVYTTQRSSNATQPSGAYMISCPVVVALIAGDIITVTLSGATTDRMISAVSVSGVLTASSPADVGTNAQGTATGWSSGASGTTTQGDEIVFGLAVSNDAALLTGVTSTPGAGYSEIHDFNNGDGVNLTSIYQIVSATGAQTASGTWAGAGLSPRWQAIVQTFKAASAGSPAPIPAAKTQFIYMRKNT